MRPQTRLWRRVIARDREPSPSEQKTSRVDVIAVQNFAGLIFFDSDLSCVHGAPLLIEIGSLRQLSRVLKDRHSRGPKNLRVWNFLEAISAAPLAPCYCSRSGAFDKRTGNFEGRCNRGPKINGPDFFDSDLNRAHGAPLLLEVGSPRHVSRVVKRRHSRGPKIWRA